MRGIWGLVTGENQDCQQRELHGRGELRTTRSGSGEKNGEERGQHSISVRGGRRRMTWNKDETG